MKRKVRCNHRKEIVQGFSQEGKTIGRLAISMKAQQELWPMSPPGIAYPG
jgi:hypothetical protein